MTKILLTSLLIAAAFLDASAQTRDELASGTADLPTDAYQRLRIISPTAMLRGYCFASSDHADTTTSSDGNNGQRRITERVGAASGTISMVAQPASRVSFGDGYRGMRMLLVNATDTVASFKASDGRLYIVQEALDARGEWRFIEYLPSSWCANSYHTVSLAPGHYWAFAAPRYSGSIRTKLRFRLIMRDRNGERSLYSNEFEGSVNPGQFTELEGYATGGIMDPYDVVARREGVGLIDREGRVVVEPVYDEIRAGRASLCVRRDGKWGAIDQTGRVLLPLQYDDAYDRGEGYIAINIGARLEWNGTVGGGRWGLADTSGAVLIDPRYDRIDELNCGLAIVRLDDAYGLVDVGGRELVQPVATDVRFIARGLVAVKIDGIWSLADPTGARRLLPGVTNIGSAFNGHIAAEVGGRWGVIDLSGRTVIEPTYDHIVEIRAGLVVVGLARNQRTLSCGVVDTTGRLIVPIEYGAIHILDDTTLHIEKGERAARANRSGAFITDFRDRGAMRRESSRARNGVNSPRLPDRGTLHPTHEYRGDRPNGWAVEIDGRFGWMDTSGALTIPVTWSLMLEDVTDDRVIVGNGEHFGVVATDGRVIVAPRYRQIHPYRRGVAIVVDAGGDE